MLPLAEVEVRSLPLERLEGVIAPERVAPLRATAERARRMLDGRVVWNVNSTARGGGVAEMLLVLVGYSRGLGVDARWVVVPGDAEFFTITKRIHNQVHGWPGDGGPLGEGEAAHYVEVLAESARGLLERVRPGDVVLLHDPQTAGLVSAMAAAGATVIWRCHIGNDVANRYTEQAWNFLRLHLGAAHALVFSRAEYVPAWVPDGVATVIPPSIDPRSPKNDDLDPATVRAVLAQAGIVSAADAGSPAVFTRLDGSRGQILHQADLVGTGPAPDERAPLVVQVSRWDRLKDMAGVMRGFAQHVARTDAHLALAAPSVVGVADDPEGAEVLEECLSAWRALPDDARSRVHLVCLPMGDVDENAVMVNALQRHAAVVVQKSLAEGFGLTVAEAMWKARPVVASAVGGIRDQVTADTGVLLDDPADLPAFGAAVTGLLDRPDEAARLGANARERVRRHFLGDRHLLHYAALLERLL